MSNRTHSLKVVNNTWLPKQDDMILIARDGDIAVHMKEAHMYVSLLCIVL